MDYIQHLSEQNISFHYFSRDEAAEIMEKEYSYYKLLEFSTLFERYKTTNKKGNFVKLDFSQLYFLALIDFRLCSILMSMCLEIENALKTRLLCDADRVGDTKSILSEYYESDKDYLEQTYNSVNIEVLKNNNLIGAIDSLDLNQFLKIVQFGTLEKIIKYFYGKYSAILYDSEFVPYERQLDSVRRIRNFVAHNNSILCDLNKKQEYNNLELSAFLGKKGIKHKTLKTNMSKVVISDLCNLLYVYVNTVSNSKHIFEILREFDVDYCQKYAGFFVNNCSIKSAYKFMKEVTKIFEEELKNDTVNHF